MILIACPLRSAESAVSPAEVLVMMDTQPAVEYGKTGHKWSRVAQAAAIAKGIARVALSRQDAAELVVYDVREGGNRLKALGDHGHSHGPWQLSDLRVPPEVAEDAEKGAKAWLGVAEDSRLSCAEQPLDEQLAVVASGDCHKALRLVRHRAHLARVALGSEPLTSAAP